MLLLLPERSLFSIELNVRFILDSDAGFRRHEVGWPLRKVRRKVTRGSRHFLDVLGGNTGDKLLVVNLKER